MAADTPIQLPLAASRRRCSPSGIGSRIVDGFEEMLEEPVRRIEKVACDQEVLRFTILDLLDGIPIETEQDRPWIAQDNWRVSRDQELGMSWRREVVDDLQKCKRRWGESAASGSSRM